MIAPFHPSLDPFKAMQAAVDIVEGSPHPTSKVAAALHGIDEHGAPFLIARTNFWPPAIENTIGRETRIGNSSGTIHAETACIIAAPRTEGASIFVTDPPCPNCVKNMIDAGVCALYIDHKGFTKDFARRHGHHFDGLSMRLCEEAGIPVYEIRRKEMAIIPIFIPALVIPQISQEPGDIIITPLAAQESFASQARRQAALFGDLPYAAAIAHRKENDPAPTLIAAAQSSSAALNEEESREGKYSIVQNPLNRLLMTAARHGLRIDPETVYSSRIPSARELVNMVGGGVTKLTIGDTDLQRDDAGRQALEQLKQAGILTCI